MSINTLTKFEIQKILVISTAHITLKDNKHLEYDAIFPDKAKLIVDKFNYGYYICVSNNPIKNEFYSDAVWNLIQLAKDQGCQYLKLDRDGQIYNELEKFDW